MRRGFFGEENVNAFVLFVGGEALLFVVAALGVDFPKVEFLAGLKPRAARQSTQMPTGKLRSRFTPWWRYANCERRVRRGTMTGLVWAKQSIGSCGRSKMAWNACAAPENSR